MQLLAVPQCPFVILRLLYPLSSRPPPIRSNASSMTTELPRMTYINISTYLPNPQAD